MTRTRPRSSARGKRVQQRFAEAMQLQRAGNLAEAERLLLKIVDGDPAHAQAHHALALMRHRQGRSDDALALMRKGAAGHGVDASLLNNLGNMLRETGRDAEAVQAYRDALALDDNNLNTHFNLAGLLFAAGDPVGAADAYTRVLSAAPDDVGVRINLARALLGSGRVEEALQHLARARELAPDDPGCAVVTIQALMGAYRTQDAMALGVDAARRWPGDPFVLHALAASQLVAEDYEGAERTLEAILAQAPDDPEALMSMTRALLGQWRLDDALARCDAFIVRNPGSADGHSCRGLVLKHAGRLDEAVAAFQAAIERDPEFAAAWSNLGQTWVDIGQMDRARESLDRSLALDPDQPEALFNVVNIRRNGAEHREQIERMARLAESWNLSAAERVPLNFALGKAYDDLADYDRAFAHYQRGNELKRLTVEFLPDRFREWAQGFHDTFDAEFLERCAGFGVDSERPVFIVGVPRSGTTLVEQILASHPAVHGADELTTLSTLAGSIATRIGAAGEYPWSASTLDRDTAQALGQAYLDHIASLDADALRVTDKMPSNYFHLGLIAAILPRARIIHCRRDPMDACFSNFVQLFGDGHYYAYSLEHIAVYYREYQRIMDHWRAVLPLSMHELDYEAMVEDPQAETRALLEHLDLPWDDACLDFHRTRRAVRTASHWQVRQPIYRSSRQRWRRYESHLQELARQIGYQAPGAA